MLCNMGLSGVAFVGCDVGGFAGNATAELFARWMRGDALSTHAWSLGTTTARHEPWVLAIASNASAANISSLRYCLPLHALGKQLQLVHQVYAHYHTISPKIPTPTL